MSKNIRTRDGARHFVTKITLPKASDVTWSWPIGWCTGLQSWLRGFDAQLGHLRCACTSLPQKFQAAIKWLEITKTVNKIKKRKHLTSSPYPLKKLCGSRRFGKMIKKSLGGRSPPLAPRGGAPGCELCECEGSAYIPRPHV